MSKEYDSIIIALNKLQPAELVALLEHIAGRLKKQLQVVAADMEEHDEGVRRYLPRLPQMIEWRLVVPLEDKLFVRDAPDQPALLLDANRVAYQGQTMTINDWAKQVTGWKSISVYEWVVVERAGRTLGDLRQTYMEQNGLE